MKLKDLTEKLKNLLVIIVGKRISWYYVGENRMIIERALIATFSGLYELRLQEIRPFCKGKNFYGTKLRYATVWKHIPKRKQFGKHTIPAKREKVFSGPFERCIREIEKVTKSSKCHVGQKIELQSFGAIDYLISDIIFIKKEPTEIQLISEFNPYSRFADL